jgi:hypothetical protein
MSDFRIRMKSQEESMRFITKVRMNEISEKRIFVKRGLTVESECLKYGESRVQKFTFHKDGCLLGCSAA